MCLVHLAQLTAQSIRLCLVSGGRVFQETTLNDIGVFVLKLLERPEDLGLHKVEDGPKLNQIVLKGRARKDQANSFDTQSDQVPTQLSVYVLSTMTLVHDNKIISHLAQVDFLRGDHAIAGDKDASTLTQFAHLQQAIGPSFVVELHNVFDIRAPFLQLGLPIHLHSSRNDH